MVDKFSASRTQDCSTPFVFKAGSTFDVSGPIVLKDNGVQVADLTGFVVTSEIRRPDGSLVAKLDASWLDATKCLVRLRATESTRSWPEGIVNIDIVLVSPTGDVMPTDTEQFKIERGVTHA
jgi:hypothetical protein